MKIYSIWICRAESLNFRNVYVSVCVRAYLSDKISLKLIIFDISNWLKFKRKYSLVKKMFIIKIVLTVVDFSWILKNLAKFELLSHSKKPVSSSQIRRLTEVRLKLNDFRRKFVAQSVSQPLIICHALGPDYDRE